MIPFELCFVDREPQTSEERRADLDLPQKLKLEDSGILAWLVRGCISYQENGLKPPKIIREATSKYQRNEDLLADFIEDCCFLDPAAETASTVLYTAFTEWYGQNIGDVKYVPSQKKFGTLMTQKFKKDSKKRPIIYYGVGLT